MYKFHKLRLRLTVIFLTLLPILTLTLYISLYERNVLPAAEEIARQKCVTAINASIAECLKELDISASELCSPHFDEKGYLTYMEVDSAQVNRICAAAAERISKELNSLASEPVRLPVGALTGFNALSHMGPSIPVYLTPTGSTTADYESEARGTGIGQVNFRVWLVTASTIGITNPLSPKKLTVTRKLMLVNTVFRGEVPNNFYGKPNY